MKKIEDGIKVKIKLSDGTIIEGTTITESTAFPGTKSLYKHPYYGVMLKDENIICVKYDEIILDE